MIKVISFIVFAAIVVSCSKPISTEELTNLNGYRELSEVKTADSNPKEFQSNKNVDFFELKDSKGIRTKLIPQLDRKNQSNGIQEHFSVIDSANATYLKYTTEYAKWTEKVEKLSADELVI